MVKEELVEGIKQAISKGESIEKAMMTFYSAGYSKQDIEEAAAASQTPTSFQQPTQPQATGSQPQKMQPQATPSQSTPSTEQQTTVPQPQKIQPGVVQRVSAYGPKPNKKGMAITIILVVILLILVGILIAVILFKNEISDFFAGIWRALF